MTTKPQKVERERLDILVVERGIASSRERAQGMIMAGQILVAGQVADKAGMRVAIDATIDLVGPTPEQRFVSRGGLKLERALDAFTLNPLGLIALDVGSSTGGFTDLLLQRGVPRVFAVDVGTGQLAWTLRSDPRVTVMERTNIRDLTQLPDGVLAQCCVIDVSFISLRLVLPPTVALLTAGAWIVALVKPQFEAGKREADRGAGVIRDPEVHRRVLRDLLAAIATHLPRLTPRGLIPSPITGRDGNHEYLLWLTYGAEQDAHDNATAAIDVDATVNLALTTTTI